jgi:hypothetical protein
VTFQDAPDGSIAVTGDVDVAAAAGVTLGEPVEPTPTPTPTPSPTPSPTPTPPLAQTGGDLARLGLIAAGLIGAGLLVRRFSRRGQDVIA